MNSGGAERVAAELANAWAQRGDQVCLVPTHLASTQSFYPLDEQVHFKPLSAFMPACAKGLTLVRKWQAIQQVHQQFKPDVVVSFLTNVNVNVLWALKKYATPVVVCERTNPVVSQSAGRVLQFLRRHTYKWAQAVVMQTAEAAHAFAQREPALGRLEVIPNPLASALAQQPAAAHVAEETAPMVMAMGRLVPVKQFEVLIRAFALIAAEFPQWKMRIYGQGPERESLQQQITQAGLSARIQLAGQTHTPWEHLRQAQLFVLSSAYEGFPNALLEAMGLGLPCISTDCPSGPRELSQQGQDALLVPVGDELALSQTLAQLMQDKTRRLELAQQAYASVRKRYAMPQILAQWDHLFTRLVVKP